MSQSSPSLNAPNRAAAYPNDCPEINARLCARTGIGANERHVRQCQRCATRPDNLLSSFYELRSGCGVVATTNVLGVSHQFKVGRPDAVTVGAPTFLDVIPFKTFGRASYKKVMGKSALPTEPQNSIAIGCSPTQPQGAAISTAGINMAPEPDFLIRPFAAGLAHHQRIAGTLPATVVGIAPSTSDNDTSTIGNATLSLHRNLHSSGVTRPDVSASRPHSILPERGE